MLQTVKTVVTADLYEGSWYLVNGGKIENVEIIEEAGKPICNISISGTNLTSLQLDYYNGRSVVNLLDFRRSYQRIHNLVLAAKKEVKKILKDQKASREVES